MKKIVAIYMVLLLFSMIVVSVSAQSGVTFGIRFDKTKYGVGETAVATFYVSGLSEDIILGGIGANLSFSADDLQYTNAAISEVITNAAPATAEIGCKEQSGKQIIYVYFVDDEGVAVELNEREEFEIATINFKVKNPEDKEIKISFEDESLIGTRPNEVIFPYKTDIFDNQLNQISYAFSNPATANTEDFVFSGDATPVLTGGAVMANPVVCTAGAMMVTAKLYSVNGTTEKLLAAPVIRFIQAGTMLDWDVSFTYNGPTEGVKVTYYFWGLGSGLMQPVQEAVTYDVAK